MLVPLSVPWCGAGSPNETCRLLLGQAGPDWVRVHEAVAAENFNRERYRTPTSTPGPPAPKTARALGLTVVGMSSTTTIPLSPSETDRNGAWEGLWSVRFLSVTAEDVPISCSRSWRLRGQMEEGSLEKTSGMPGAGDGARPDARFGPSPAAPRGGWQRGGAAVREDLAALDGRRRPAVPGS